MPAPTSPWWLLVIHLGVGLVTGPLAARRIVAPGVRSPRREMRNFARWVRDSRSGLVATVLLWPLVLLLVQVGFLAGWWDWRGLRDPQDPAG